MIVKASFYIISSYKGHTGEFKFQKNMNIFGEHVKVDFFKVDKQFLRPLF
jgi:hypothetical protein